MQLFDGTESSKGLSKPKNMSDYLGKQMLQYDGAYLTYHPRGKDRVQFTPPCNESKTPLVDVRNPMSHLSGMGRENHIIYKEDGTSEETHSHSSSPDHASVKQGFKLYKGSPRISTPPAARAEAMRNPQKRGDNLSPSSQSSVYLAIPKPVYGHNPCCGNPGCAIGHRYSMEHGSQRIPNTVFEHDWMHAGAHYNERPPIQRSAQDALLLQRGLQFEPSAEQLKRMPIETHSPGRARMLPALIEPNYSRYPCTLTPTLFSSLSEQSSQTSSRGYPSLYPSHHTYEHMTSEFYQDHSPMSKYGHLTQHPMFYYTKADVEVASRTQCKDIGSKQREDVPVILKHTIANPREHYMVPQSLHGEIPFPLASTEALQNHSLKQGFGYPCFTYPGIHINASQIRPPLKRQQTLPVFSTNCINVSPSGQCIDHPITSATNLQKDKLNAFLHVEHAEHANLPFLCVEQIGPTRHTRQPGMSPTSMQMNRFFPPLGGFHRAQPVPPPTALNMDRYRDYSSSESQVRSPKEPNSLPVSPAARQALPPHVSVDPSDTTPYKKSKVRKIIYSPTFVPAEKVISPLSNSRSTVLKGCLKRSISHLSPPIKMKEEGRNLCEVEVIKKQQKVEMANVKEAKKIDSPPMPVIDNVFSLAPYQAYLKACTLFCAGREPQRPAKSSEQSDIKNKPDVKEKRQDKDEQEPVVCQVSKEHRTSCTTEKPEVEIVEPEIKVEKKNSDTDNFVESPVSQDYSKAELKKEPEEIALSSSEPMLVIMKYEPNELQSTHSLAHKNETSQEAKPRGINEQMSSSHQADAITLHGQVLTIQPNSITPPKPPEHRLSFKNIPLQCLKLSNYKLILHNKMDSSPVPPPEKPNALPTSECTPKPDIQMPARKHFLVLHQALHQLISKSVSASPEQELRTWLSQLDLTEPVSPSTKAKRVSSLLGVKAREVWLNEEIRSALHQLLERLREYTAQERCPFPHVMRARAVFLPMLVVKEMLFPTVHGSFIDQVLQEHKVELRPTTLSEEKILIQLFKRPCSSRLMRLMSLKHLPDIYADVVNIYYYICVCRHLESTSPDVQKRVQKRSIEKQRLVMDDLAPRAKDECLERISRTPAFYDSTTSPASPEAQAKVQEGKPNLNRNGRKSRVKSSSKRTFLDNSLSDEEETEDAASEGGLNALSNTNWSDHQSEETESSLCTSSENSWTHPLTSDELSSFPHEPETEEPSSPRPISQSSGPDNPAVRPNCSGIILKLRRMFSKGLDRKKARYQKITGSRTFVDPSLTQTDKGEVGSEVDLHRRTPKATRRWQRTGGFSHDARPLNSSSKRKQKSLLKIKYCPYLAACHSAERRKRWVLRSAVQRAQRFYYPDLVGKRIRHLYEENDKSEAWYNGEVLRVHEAHTNPLKTIYEVRYDSEPEWKYYLELLMDYEKGWLKIED